MKLIDSHNHLYADDFAVDRDDIVSKALQAGVHMIVMPNIDGASVSPMLDVYHKYPGICWPSIGLHPCSVHKDFKDVLQQMDTWSKDPAIAWKGIGETGLDYYWDKTFIPEQKESFDIQLEWAKTRRLPIIIHSRDSLDDCIDMVAAKQDGSLTGVFHCFSGNRAQLDRVKDLGFFAGIGGVVTFKNGGLDKVLEKSDLPQLILETDAPYLAPVPHRGKRNEPAYVPLVAHRLAELCQVDVEQIARITTENSKSLFQLSA